MARTKEVFTEEIKWMNTARHLSKVIPNCETLANDRYGWKEQCDESHHIIPTIKKAIKQSVSEWIRSTSAQEVIDTVKQINLPARKHLVKVLPIQYRGFFEYQGGQFPIELSCPIPFFPYEKRLGEKVHVSKIVMEYGETRIIVSHILCKPDDLKGWVALNQIRKRGLCKVTEGEDAIIIRTSFADIAKELGIINPWDKNVRKGIREMLDRLRTMSLSWEKGKGKNMKFHDGGLLHLTTNLDEDTDGNLKILMDRFFTDLLMPQFNGFDEKVLFNLSGRQVNLYIYLNRDMAFNKFGEFNSRNFNQSYIDVYRNASLHSPAPISKQLSQGKIKTDLKIVLNGLKSKGVISRFGFTKLGYLRVFK